MGVILSEQDGGGCGGKKIITIEKRFGVGCSIFQHNGDLLRSFLAGLQIGVKGTMLMRGNCKSRRPIKIPLECVGS